MKTLFRACCLVVAVLAVSAAASLRAATVAFVDVTVIPMDSERTLPGQTVLVSGDRIVRVGPSATVTIPDGAVRIDGRGKFLIPGLGEMHGHNPPVGSSQEYIENTYYLFVANGVTTVRGMLGWPGQLELRDKVQKGEILGPALYLAGPSFSGGAVQNPVAAEARVRQQKAEGWDLLKVHPGLSRASYDAMARTAHELGIRFAGHVPADVGLLHAIERRQETIDHIDGYIELLHADSAPVDRARLAEVVKLTRDTGTWVVPTMVLWETIIGSARHEDMQAFPELKYMPRAEVERWRTVYDQRIKASGFSATKVAQIAANRNAVLKALHEADVKIAFGTDAPQQYSVPGFSIHREMKAMAAVGMSPYAILRSATSRVGEYFAFKDHFGQVTEGHRADLVLLDANPLSDIDNVSKRSGVMVRGRWLPEAELQAGLAKIEAAMKQ